MEAKSLGTKKSNEINFSDFITLLWRYKLIIFGITSAFALAGIAYSYLSTPVYRSQATITPPPEKSLIELRKIQSLLVQAGYKPNNADLITTETIFSRFMHDLNSHRYKKEFLSRPDVLNYFKKNDGSTNKAIKDFNKALKISLPKRKPYHKISLSLSTTSPELSAKWLSEYISYSESRFIQELESDITAQITAMKHNLSNVIISKKENYKSKVQEEISNLKEALYIADEIGLENPLATESIFYSPSLVIEMRNLYHLGSRALSAELKALEKRSKGISTGSISGLAEFQFQLELLSNATLDSSQLSSMTLDLVPEEEERPIKPRRIFISALSLLFGLFVGVTVAIINHIIRQKD